MTRYYDQPVFTHDVCRLIVHLWLIIANVRMLIKTINNRPLMRNRALQLDFILTVFSNTSSIDVAELRLPLYSGSILVLTDVITDLIYYVSLNLQSLQIVRMVWWGVRSQFRRRFFRSICIPKCLAKASSYNFAHCPDAFGWCVLPGPLYLGGHLTYVLYGSAEKF